MDIFNDCGKKEVFIATFITILKLIKYEEYPSTLQLWNFERSKKIFKNIQIDPKSQYRQIRN